jgi:hypothetical protein
VRTPRRRGPVLCPIRPPHARQSRTSLAHYLGQCVGDAPQHGRSQLHVTAESTKFRDCKGIETDVGATPHPLRVLLELGRLSTA